MDFPFQQRKEILKARGIPGDTAPSRENKHQNQNPWRGELQTRSESVIFQKFGRTPEAHRVMLAKTMEKYPFHWRAYHQGGLS